MIETLKIDDLDIFVERKNIKHMYLRILPPEGNIKISAPLAISNEQIINFVISKSKWIHNKQENMKKAPKKVDYKYLSGEIHFLWGKKYTLQLISKNKNFKNVFVEDDSIFLPVSKNDSIEKREKMMIEWYRNELKNRIPQVLEKSIAIVGKAPEEWRVKNMKTRWGTCNVSKKRIWLNLQLAKHDPICLEYVIIHELVHFYVANHSKEFKSYIDKFYPNWPEVKKLVNSPLI